LETDLEKQTALLKMIKQALCIREFQDKAQSFDSGLFYSYTYLPYAKPDYKPRYVITDNQKDVHRLTEKEFDKHFTTKTVEYDAKNNS